MAFGIQELKHHLDARFDLIERTLATMATRAEFDALKASLKAEIQAVVQAVTDLRNQLANGNPITDQDLADLGDDLNQLTGSVPPPPPPTP